MYISFVALHITIFRTLQCGIAPTRLFHESAPRPAPQHTSTSPHTHAHTGRSSTEGNPTQHNTESSPRQQHGLLPHTLSTDAPLSTASNGDSANNAGVVCSTLLGAMEGAHQGLLSLACRVLRVYRRAVHPRAVCTSET